MRSGLLLFSRVSFYLLLYLLCFLFYPLPNLICLLFYTLRRLLHLLLDLLFYSRSASCRTKYREQSGREEDSQPSPHASPSLEVNLLSGASPGTGLQNAADWGAGQRGPSTSTPSRYLVVLPHPSSIDVLHQASFSLILTRL